VGGRVARLARTWLAVMGVALGVSLLVPATPAAAHNSLTGSDPANGARLATAPTTIQLRFLAKPDPNTTQITVTGPDNVPAAGGKPSFAGSRVSVPFRPGAAGLYLVGYQVPSSDGHTIKGEVRFTLTTGTPAEPPSASPAAPSTPGSPAATTPATTPTSGSASPVAVDPVSDEGGTRAWLWVLAAVALAAALAATLLYLRRRPTPR
jgi:methionine-rich copper-binding protein CopC